MQPLGHPHQNRARTEWAAVAMANKNGQILWALFNRGDRFRLGRRFLEELLVLGVILRIAVILGLADTVGVMSLVIEHEDVLLPADFLADDAVDYCASLSTCL
jgi:hypothetical protein